MKPEALDTVRQRHTTLFTCLKKYTREEEARIVEWMFYAAETEEYWKSMREKQASHDTRARWLMDLRADCTDLPELPERPSDLHSDRHLRKSVRN